jgi:multicomponent Na+:H+ antiporter subunit B
MITLIAAVLTVLVAASAIALIRVHDLFALVVLLSVYSGLLALTFALLGAVDVAFTEVVVGTSVSTVFFMALMWWINPHELSRYQVPRRAAALVVAGAVGGLLLYGIEALPPFGDPAAPAMLHVSPRYAELSLDMMATPNVVTAVLADFRSLDTLIETAVVLTAALACLLVLRYRNDPAVQ